MTNRPEAANRGAWRSRAARTGIAVCLAALVVTVVVQLARDLRSLDGRAARSASYSYEDRLFAAGNGIVPDKQLLYQARTWIPARGSYRVVVGDGGIAGETSLTRTYTPTFATYFLMPRRPSPTSRWILCLGCDVASIGGHVETIWSDGAGSALLRAGR